VGLSLCTHSFPYFPEDFHLLPRKSFSLCDPFLSLTASDPRLLRLLFLCQTEPGLKDPSYFGILMGLFFFFFSPSFPSSGDEFDCFITSWNASCALPDDWYSLFLRLLLPPKLHLRTLSLILSSGVITISIGGCFLFCLSRRCWYLFLLHYLPTSLKMSAFHPVSVHSASSRGDGRDTL